MRRAIGRAVVAKVLVGPARLEEQLEFRTRGRAVVAIGPAVVPALLQCVDLLIGLQRVFKVARILALEERETGVRKLRMYRERHGVAEPAREDFARRIGIAGLQRRKDATLRRREGPDRGERRGALARGAGLAVRIFGN